jgi:hypothetical protein
VARPSPTIGRRRRPVLGFHPALARRRRERQSRLIANAERLHHPHPLADRHAAEDVSFDHAFEAKLLSLAQGFVLTPERIDDR